MKEFKDKNTFDSALLIFLLFVVIRSLRGLSALVKKAFGKYREKRNSSK